MQKWKFGGIMMSLLLMGCVLTTWLPNHTAEPTPDAFQLTATRLIADATILSGRFDPQLLTEKPELVTALIADGETSVALSATSQHGTDIVENQTETKQSIASETATALGTLPPYRLTETPIYQTQLAAVQLLTSNPPAVTATLAARQTVLAEQRTLYSMYETQNAAARISSIPALETAQALGTLSPHDLTMTVIVQNLTSTVELKELETENPQAVTQTIQAVNAVATENAAQIPTSNPIFLTETAMAVYQHCVPGQVTIWYTSEWDRLYAAFEARGYYPVVDVYGQSYTDDCIVYDVMSKTYFFMIAGQSIETIVTDVIEIMQDYPAPPSIYNASPLISIEVTVLDETNTVITRRRISFSNDEAKNAYENGLRGVELLDALGIILPPDE